MVALVEQMLDLNKRLSAAQTQHEKILLQRQIEATERQIDQLVYELCELTGEEINLVEENAWWNAIGKPLKWLKHRLWVLIPHE